MEKQINFRAVLILVVSAAACAAAIHFVHAFQVRRLAQTLLDEGKRFEENGELSRAADDFVACLALAPDHADAKAQFALLSQKMAKTDKQRIEAYLLLLQAWRADMTRVDIRRELARLALLMGRYDEARQHLDDLLKAEPDDTELLVLRARCADRSCEENGTADEVRAKEEGVAGSLYKQALGTAPNDIAVSIEYANYLRKRRDTLGSTLLEVDNAREHLLERAENVVADMLKANDYSPKARFAAALFEESIGRLEKSEEHYQAALKSAPNDLTLLRTSALFHLRNWQTASAIPILRKLMESAAAGKDANLIVWSRRKLALLLAAQGGYPQFKEAQQLLEQNRKEVGETVEDKRAHALVLATRAAHRQQALQLFESLGQIDNSERLLIARLQELQGDWPAAEKQYLALLKSNDKNPIVLANYIRGLLSRSEKVKAQENLLKLVDSAPEWVETLDLQVRVLNKTDAGSLVRNYSANAKGPRLDLAGYWFETLNEPAEADKMYRKFAEESKRPSDTLVRARFLGRNKKVDAGLAICQKAWATCDPLEVAVACKDILRSGGIKENAQVEAALRAAIEKNPDRHELKLVLAELLEVQERYDDAMALFRKVLEKDPANAIALNNLSNLLALKGTQLDNALEMIQRAIERAGPAPEFLDTRALVYLGQHRAEEAVKDLLKAIEDAPTIPAVFYLHLARAQLAAGARAPATASRDKAIVAGLKIEMLHPLERADFDKLLKSLE